ncbi:hypothetical protein DFH09DRAFT_1134398, partial [Mycena vulgaris]
MRGERGRGARGTRIRGRGGRIGSTTTRPTPTRATGPPPPPAPPLPLPPTPEAHCRAAGTRSPPRTASGPTAAAATPPPPPTASRPTASLRTASASWGAAKAGTAGEKAGKGGETGRRARRRTTSTRCCWRARTGRPGRTPPRPTRTRLRTRRRCTARMGMAGTGTGCRRITGRRSGGGWRGRGCVEKWGPGPLGPGTVCDRCRKKMKRVERRGTLEQQAASAAVTPATTSTSFRTASVHRTDTLPSTPYREPAQESSMRSSLASPSHPTTSASTAPTSTSTSTPAPAPAPNAGRIIKNRLTP